MGSTHLRVLQDENIRRKKLVRKEVAMELIVEGKGTFVGKHQGRLRVSREQKTLTEVPLIHLDQVIIVDSGVAISRRGRF